MSRVNPTVLIISEGVHPISRSKLLGFPSTSLRRLISSKLEASQTGGLWMAAAALLMLFLGTALAGFPAYFVASAAVQ
jgi:hypothetical protein